MPKISVIIPVYKDLYGLSKTLKSIDRQSFQDYEIIVINDGANAEIEAFCKAKGLQIKNVYPRKGSYNARNVGIKLAKTNYLAFTDADLVASDNWLAMGINNLNIFDYVAGSIQIDKELVVDIATFHDFLTAFPIENYFEHHHFGATANLFVKKAVFDQVGDFDSALQSGGDLEFGDRVYRAGISQVYDKNCSVKHPPRNHAAKINKLRRIRQGQKMLLKKYPNRFKFLKNYKGIIQLLKHLLPPKWRAAREIYQDGYSYPVWDLYKYIFKLKMLVFKINYLEK